MPILNDEVRSQVQSIFDERLRDDVTLDLYIKPKSKIYLPGRRDCETCDDARQLYEEVSDLSGKLSLVVHDLTVESASVSQDDIPLCVLHGHNKGELRILGLPAGYEFSTLLEDIVDLSTGETALSDETRESLASLENEVKLDVFVTPT